MKKTRLLAMLVLGGLMAFGPQVRGEDEKKPERPKAPEGGKAGMQDRLKKIAEDLKLTDEQKEKWRPIMQEQFEKLKALREDTTSSQEEKKAKFREIAEANAVKVKAILTPEQVEKWEKMRGEFAQKRKKE